jgi:hypothetical protein
MDARQTPIAMQSARLRIFRLLLISLSPSMLWMPLLKSVV